MSAEDMMAAGSKAGQVESEAGSGDRIAARKHALPRVEGGSSPQPGRPKGSAVQPRVADRPDPVEMDSVVRAALREAELAFAEARTAKLDADGQDPGLCGFSRIVAYAVKPWLRATLKRLGEAESDGKGAWKITGLSDSPSGFGIRANTAACDAGCEVLRRRLGHHADFYVQTFLD